MYNFCQQRRSSEKSLFIKICRQQIVVTETDNIQNANTLLKKEIKIEL